MAPRSTVPLSRKLDTVVTTTVAQELRRQPSISRRSRRDLYRVIPSVRTRPDRWRRGDRHARTSALPESARRNIASIRQSRACEFAHRHQPGSGRRRCWWSTSSRGAGVTASGVEQQHDQWALRPTSPATVTGRAFGAGAAGLETRAARRTAEAPPRPDVRIPERNHRSDAGDKTPAGRPQARASIVTIRPCLGHCICRPSDRLGRTDRGAEHEPVGAASELYPEVVDTCEEEGGVPSRLIEDRSRRWPAGRHANGGCSQAPRRGGRRDAGHAR